MATRVDEVAEGIYRINTGLDLPGGDGFSFNQYLVADDEPLLFHTGLRRMFADTRDAVARVMPPERLRYIAFSHFESDECGALNAFLGVAPRAEPVCSTVAAMVSVGDYADRAPHALADGERLTLGRRRVRWIDAPHLPHAWECGYLIEETTGTLLCGDLFTQGGAATPALTEADILSPSESFRRAFDYFSHTKNARGLIERLASERPQTLACMHGSAWRGDGAALLRALADSLEK